MEDVIKQAAGQLPGTVLVVIVVVAFLKFMLKVAESLRVMHDENKSFIRQLHEEHLSARTTQRDAIVDNTRAMKDLMQVVKNWPFDRRDLS